MTKKTLSSYLLDLVETVGMECWWICSFLISKIELDSYLSFPRAFIFNVPQGSMSKAGREDSETVWATLATFPSLFPNSALPLIAILTLMAETDKSKVVLC